MLGRIVYQTGGGRLRLEEERICGVPVARVEFDPEGWRAQRRLRRAGRLLAKAGVRQVLTPAEFDRWETLERYGLRRVDPVPFLRAHGAELAVAALRRAGKRPERCAVALRAERVDRDVVRAAEVLCGQVRDVCISVPRGGESLRGSLRWEFGAAVRPDWEGVAAAVRFDPGTWEQAELLVDLFPPGPDPQYVWVRLKEGEWGETERFSLIAALWERGKVGKTELEFA